MYSYNHRGVMIKPVPYIRIAYSTLELAMRNLQAYADQQLCEVCIYRVEYGRFEKRVEYQFRYMCELIDKQSDNIVASTKPRHREIAQTQRKIKVDMGESILFDYFIVSQ